MSHAITVKGQVTIPKKVREHLRLRPGDQVAFTIRPDGAVTVEPAPSTDRVRAYLERVEHLRGAWNGPPADELLMQTRGPPDETGE